MSDILIVRADQPTKERLRAFQRRLKAARGKHVSVKETLNLLMASAEAAWPVGAEPKGLFFHEEPLEAASADMRKKENQPPE